MTYSDHQNNGKCELNHTYNADTGVVTVSATAYNIFRGDKGGFGAKLFITI